VAPRIDLSQEKASTLAASAFTHVLKHPAATNHGLDFVLVLVVGVGCKVLLYTAAGVICVSCPSANLLEKMRTYGCRSSERFFVAGCLRAGHSLSEKPQQRTMNTYCAVDTSATQLTSITSENVEDGVCKVLLKDLVYMQLHFALETSLYFIEVERHNLGTCPHRLLEGEG
jgi:hypothetical protein